MTALLTPLVFLDCALNLLLGGSFSETLSARAHRLREEKHPMGWTASAIDRLFFWQDGHCQAQFERERAGGAWKALFN
jgi:hypothetical protein